MEKLPKYFGVLAFLIVLLLILYALLTYVPFKPLFPQLPLAQGQQLIITTAHEKESTDAYAIDAQYPQFGNTAIDAQIKKTLDDAVAQFKAIPPNPPDSAAPQNQFTATYDKLYVGPKHISFELVISQYTGGAHGSTAFNGLTFDRATGTELSLDDALAMTGLTLDTLAAGAKQQLQQSLGDAFMFPDGVSPDPQNFDSFTISSSTVTFVFQQYQVAAYAAGAQEASFKRVR